MFRRTSAILVLVIFALVTTRAFAAPQTLNGTITDTMCGKKHMGPGKSDADCTRDCFYRSHMAMQEMMGMIGAFIMHPMESYKPRVDKDFAIIMQEYAILPNIKVPNSSGRENRQ